MKAIAFIPIDLEEQKVTEDLGCSIELHEDHIRYHAKFWANEPLEKDQEKEDYLKEWAVRLNSFDVIIKKESVVCIEKVFTTSKQWKILISFGSHNELFIYYKRESEAQALYDALYEYIFQK